MLYAQQLAVICGASGFALVVVRAIVECNRQGNVVAEVVEHGHRVHAARKNYQGVLHCVV